MTRIRIAIAILVALASAGSLAAAQSRRIATVQTFLAARKRGDLEAARRFLAPDARIWFNSDERKGPGEPWTLEPDDWDRWDQFFRSQTVYSDWSDQAETVSAIGHESNDYYRLLDWKPKPLRFAWFFDSDGKISGFLFRALAGPPDRSRLEEFKQWARKNRPDELSYLTPKGSIDPAADRPQRWREILIQWRKAVGLPSVPVPAPSSEKTRGL